MGAGTHSRRIPFRFAGRAVDKVEAVFFSPKHASPAHSGRPLIAFTYTHIVYNQRRRHFHSRTDRPLHGRAAIKLEAVRPKDCLKDPYLVAILIAIAQHARWSDSTKGGGGPDAYPVSESSRGGPVEMKPIISDIIQTTLTRVSADKKKIKEIGTSPGSKLGPG